MVDCLLHIIYRIIYYKYVKPAEIIFLCITYYVYVYVFTRASLSSLENFNYFFIPIKMYFYCLGLRNVFRVAIFVSLYVYGISKSNNNKSR